PQTSDARATAPVFTNNGEFKEYNDPNTPFPVNYVQCGLPMVNNSLGTVRVDDNSGLEFAQAGPQSGYALVNNGGEVSLGNTSTLWANQGYLQNGSSAVLLTTGASAQLYTGPSPNNTTSTN